MLIVRKEAENDVAQAYQWYEEKKVGLGIDFLSEIESVMEQIAEHPKLCAKAFKDVRRALCKRFPYSVYYLEAGSRVVVIGVLHQR